MPKLKQLELCALKFASNKHFNLIVTASAIAISAFLLLLALFQRRLTDPMHDTPIANQTHLVKVNPNDVLRPNVDGITTTISLLLLLIPALAFGQLASHLRLPPLLGHLLVGILVRNINVFANFYQINQTWARAIFQLSFVLIMIRCGINLDSSRLRKSLGIFLSLGFVSTTVEALLIIAAAYLLHLPIGLDVLFGFVLASTSPAVTVPSMLQLQQAKLGTEKGIPTTVLAAATIDNIYSVTAFSIASSIVFASQSSLLYNLLSPPIELIIGVVGGVGLGLFLWFFPRPSEHYLHFVRCLTLSTIAMAVLIGSRAVNHMLVGPVALVLMCIVAAYRWKTDNVKGILTEQACFKILWDIALQPFLFALIGLLFDFSQMTWTIFGYASLFIFIGVLIRFAIIFTMSFAMSDFNVKEQLFISICFFPKATVQAVLAPIILQEVEKDPSKFEKSAVQMVVQTCILSILLTAPLGQLIIWQMGKRLLKEDDSTSKTINIFSEEPKPSSVRPTSTEKPTVISVDDQNLAILEIKTTRSQDSKEPTARDKSNG